MSDAIARQRRLIRTVLAIRAAAIVCLGLSLQAVAAGIGDAVAGFLGSQRLSDPSYAWTERILVAVELISWPALLDWIGRYGHGPMLLGLGAYLWARRPEQLLRSSGRGPP